MSAQKNPLIQAHRGARGHFPENTIVAFGKTVAMGFQVIELDIVVSSDSQLVISHEPWMHPDYCSFPDGTPVKRNFKSNLYKMKYDSIRAFDCGKRGNKKFPEQEKIPSYKPLLREAIDSVDAFARAHAYALPVYNIEVKCMKPGDGKFHPAPKRFAQLILKALNDYPADRFYIQSFDHRVLQELHKVQPGWRYGFLQLRHTSVKHQLKKLGYTPFMFNPPVRAVDAGLVKAVHEKGMQIHVWTVNEEKDLKRMKKLGVDGVITDYPDRARKIFDQTDSR